MNILRNILYISLMFVFADTAVTALYLNVSIQNGTVTGQRYTISGKNGWEFLGIPFARPPINELRFARPQPIRSAWTKPLNATKPGNRCMSPFGGHRTLFKELEARTQMKFKFDEDCLYLNIWTPDGATSKPRAVMVWIHDGAYQRGESYPFFNGRALAVVGDVVVVTIQYRLNVFGFFYLNESVPGNWGLWDQQMAIRWVSENIRQFGGDPSKTTLFGSNAGAASVSLHLLNSESLRYFRRAILQSGSANAPWAVHEATSLLDASQALLRLVCQNLSVPEIMACLRNLTAKQLLDFTTHELFYNDETPRRVYHMLWMPVVDGDFITKLPNKTMHEGSMEKKDILLSYSSDEGAIFTSERMYRYGLMFPRNTSEELYTRPKLDYFIPFIFRHGPINPYRTSNEAAGSILRTAWRDYNRFTYITNLIRLSQRVGNYMVRCPMKVLARAYARINSRVFLFRYTHKPSSSPYPSYFGATQGEELPFLFALNLVYPSLNKFSFTDHEKRISLQLIRFWTTFAKTGKPHPNARRFTKKNLNIRCR